MLIHFVHTGDAYLPELQAYAAFVQATGHHAQVHHQLDMVPGDAAVLWWLCGQVSQKMARRFPAAFHIHEYASASVPPLAWLKDFSKRWRQARPNYRIYQNDWVHQRLGFSASVPFEFRDMGIAPHFFDATAYPVETEFDFVYLGEMGRLRHFLPFLDALAQLARRVLLIGQMPDDLRPLVQRHANLSVTGRIAHKDVPTQLRRARYGLNLVPDQLPYTRQTSTKLLEYCAAGLPVLSTDYGWVRTFERQHAACFAYIPCRASTAAYRNLLDRALHERPLRVPDLRALAWPRVLSGMQIWHQLGIGA